MSGMSCSVMSWHVVRDLAPLLVPARCGSAREGVSLQRQGRVSTGITSALLNLDWRAEPCPQQQHSSPSIFTFDWGCQRSYPAARDRVGEKPKVGLCVLTAPAPSHPDISNDVIRGDIERTYGSMGDFSDL